MVIQGGYEESQAAVIHRSKEDQSNNILFLDTSWEGYSTIPQVFNQPTPLASTLNSQN